MLIRLSKQSDYSNGNFDRPNESSFLYLTELDVFYINVSRLIFSCTVEKCDLNATKSLDEH